MEIILLQKDDGLQKPTFLDKETVYSYLQWPKEPSGTLHYFVAEGELNNSCTHPHAILALGTMVLLLSPVSLVSTTQLVKPPSLDFSSSFLPHSYHMDVDFQEELHTEGMSISEVPPFSGLICLVHLIITHLRMLQGNLMDTLISQKFPFFHLNLAKVVLSESKRSWALFSIICKNNFSVLRQNIMLS